MGIFIAPLLLAMVIGFSVVGLRSAFGVLVQSRQRLATALMILSMAAGLAVLAAVLPFVVMANRRVMGFGLFFSALYLAAGAAVAGGMLAGERYRKTDRTMFGVFGAACYLTAAGFPFTWFWLSERMSTLFHVTFSY